MANYNLLSVDSVIEDWLDFSGEDMAELDVTVIKKWADDCIERFMPGEQLNQRIVLINVKDYKAELPNGFKYATQVAYRDTQGAFMKQKFKREVLDTATTLLGGNNAYLTPRQACDACGENACGCNNYVLEINTESLKDKVDYNLYGKYINHFHHRGTHANTTDGLRSNYHDDFRVMRRTSNDLYNIPFHIKGCINVNADCEVEYDINRSDSGKLMLTSNKKECVILMSYLSVPLCSNGYRMIADLPIAFRCVNLFIEERIAYRTYRRSREQKDSLFHDKLVPRVEQLIGRVRSQLNQPDPDEWKQWVRNTWTKLVPGYDSQAQFGRRTNDRFRYPDQTGGLINDGGFNRR